MQSNFLIPNWDVPHNIKSLVTLRHYNNNDFNLALHSNHTVSRPEENRKLLNQYTPSIPCWLNQTHTDNIINLDTEILNSSISYDASYTTQKNIVSVVMTADCIPILITNKSGTFVSSVHAGWRGVLNQITIKTIHQSQINPNELIIYIAPAICKNHFEVGHDVWELFTIQNKDYSKYFETHNDKYLCDLEGILIEQLNKLGVHNIYTSKLCTICNNDSFYSYRKEKNTGRFASLIWIT